MSVNPKISLFITIIIVGGLSFLRGYKVYKNKLVDTVHGVMDFNLLALASFTLYNFDESDPKKQITAQIAIAWISTIVTLIVIIVVFAYHVALLIIKYKTKKEQDKDILLSSSSQVDPGPVTPESLELEDEVTHSSLQLPSRIKMLNVRKRDNSILTTSYYAAN